TVADARNATEFLEGMKEGRSVAAGESGDAWKLTQAVWDIGASMVREKPWTAILTPLMAAVPAVMIVNFLMELSFAAKWGSRMGLSVKTPVSAEALLLR